MTMSTALVLDALQLTPDPTRTTKVVRDLESVGRAVQMLHNSSLFSLMVRSADIPAPSNDMLAHAISNLDESWNLLAIESALKMPVVELPDNTSLWAAMVHQSLGSDIQGSLSTMFVHRAASAIKDIDAVERWRAMLAHSAGDIETLLITFCKNRFAETETVIGTPAPAVTPLDAARQKRDALLKSERWLSSTEVAEHARGEVLYSNPHQHASRLRREGRLFGVRLGGQYLHPAFQFQPASGEPHPRLDELLAKLPGEDNGWAAALWLFAPTRKLDGARPADVFLANPDAVIDAARRDFEGDDADW